MPLATMEYAIDNRIIDTSMYSKDIPIIPKIKYIFISLAFRRSDSMTASIAL